LQALDNQLLTSAGDTEITLFEVPFAVVTDESEAVGFKTKTLCTSMMASLL
jgi:hypothetical protein